jgi:glycosyltransferase involved in cell wall biosynthesis
MTRPTSTVLAFGTYDVTKHPRVGVLIEGLQAHGVVVSELNRPLGLSTAQRVQMLHEPWRLPMLALRLLFSWARLTVGAVRLRRPRPDAVLVGYLGHFDVLLARLLFPRTTIVLDHLIFGADTATDRGAAHGWRIRLLRGLDRLAMRAADVIVVDTEENGELVPRHRRRDVVVARVGASREWFDVATPDLESESDDPQAGRDLSVVFFGLFTPLQGTVTIGRALRLLHKQGVAVRATFIGSGQDADAVRRLVDDLPAIHWIEWVESDDLPSLVAAHDVCLGIFGTTDKALRVVPNKVYQGAAAGTLIITSDTPPQRRTLGEAAVLVRPGDAEALATALAGIASDRALLVSGRRAARQLAERSFTAAAVAEPLVEKLVR